MKWEVEMKKILVAVVSVLMILSLVACGGDNDKGYNNVEMNVAYDTDDMAADDNFGGVSYSNSLERTEEEEMKNTVGAEAPVVDQRKIIKSASMEIESLEYDLAVVKLQDKINMIGGYIESSNVRGKSLEDKYSTRSAFFTIRVPEKHFLSFMSDMNTVGNIISENTFGEDITSSYFDSEAHVKTLEIQEERLLEILKKAEKIEDVIELERELSSVRYQIEGLAGNLRRWDNLVSYATLNVSIYEVLEFTPEVVIPKTLSEKIGIAFDKSTESIKEFLEDSAVFGIGSIPYLVIYIPLIVIGVLIFRVVKKRRFKKVETIEIKEEEKK